MMTSKPGKYSLSKQKLLALYRGMVLVREAETKLSSLFADGEVPGFIHLSIGQEATSVGVSSVLEKSDTVASNHRGHGHALSKGVALDRFFLEIMGKEEGICRGRGGSMHVADLSVGMLGANGIVGAGIPMAAGSALAHQVKGNKNIAVVFFGDGALAEGVFHETLNLAALWKLPLLFVCENNGWSEFSPASKQFVAPVTKLAEAFSIPSQTIDGDSVLDVVAAADQMVSEIREGQGPRLLECITHRVRGHFEGDPQKYRNKGEMDELVSHDPILRFEKVLAEKQMTESALEKVRNDVAKEISLAVEKARAGTLPNFAKAAIDVYTPIEG